MRPQYNIMPSFRNRWLLSFFRQYRLIARQSFLAGWDEDMGVY